MYLLCYAVLKYNTGYGDSLIQLGPRRMTQKEFDKWIKKLEADLNSTVIDSWSFTGLEGYDY